MITGLRLKNLGCFDDYDYSVKFNKLNVIVGPNNSGKSTLIKAINFVRTLTLTGRPEWNTLYYHLDNVFESVYNHDQKREIRMELDYEQDGNNFTTRIAINGQGGITLADVTEGNRSVGHINNHQGNRSAASSIWYFTPNRSPIGSSATVGGRADNLQLLSPYGSDVLQFYIEKWTSQDENWNLAQEWIKKIDPQAVLFSTPLIANQVSILTRRNDGKTTTPVNLSFQGTGIQNAVMIIAAVIFSPKKSIIIIEEPENFLNSRSIEYLVDLFNYAVNKLEKQIMITTHSWEIVNAYCSDIGEGTDRGNIHEKAKTDDFKLIMVNEKLGKDKIQEYDLRGKKYIDVRNYFKQLWGVLLT